MKILSLVTTARVRKICLYGVAVVLVLWLSVSLVVAYELTRRFRGTRTGLSMGSF